MSFTLTKNQWKLIKHWIIVALAAETVMFLFNKSLLLIYLLITFLFLGGLLLRILKLYPGKEEPLILDFLAVIICLIFTFLADKVKTLNIKLLLILISSLIILPHLLYIVSKKDI